LVQLSEAGQHFVCCTHTLEEQAPKLKHADPTGQMQVPPHSGGEHSVPFGAGAQAPAWQVVQTLARQFAQAPPPLPHAAFDPPTWHSLPSQQPAQHDPP
jgi:hypothetical protein